MTLKRKRKNNGKLPGTVYIFFVRISSEYNSTKVGFEARWWQPTSDLSVAGV
jgi:hypothetical protein